MPSEPCATCGRARDSDKKYCSACLERTRLYWEKRRSELPAGKCSKCFIRGAQAGYKQCEMCREKVASAMRRHRQKYPVESANYQRTFNLDRRLKVIEHYGNKCECCGEAEPKFLVVDHKDGGGNQHRQDVRSKGSNMISWIIQNNFPPLFRVLCHNCNSAIGFYGRCPHQPGDE